MAAVAEFYGEDRLPRESLSRAAERVKRDGALYLGGGVGVEAKKDGRYGVIGGSVHDGPLSAVTAAFKLAGGKTSPGSPGGARKVSDPAVAARLFELDQQEAEAEGTIRRMKRILARNAREPLPSGRWDAGPIDDDRWERRRIREAEEQLRQIRAERERLLTGKIAERALSSGERKELPAGSFVFPKERRYPIHDLAHARNALARSSGKPEEARVRAAVYARYPQLRKGGRVQEAAEVGKPGTNWKQVGPHARKKLSGLIRHYMSKPHPFTSCVRDNTKRFGQERAERVCAVLKDLGHGGTGWRKGGKGKVREAEGPSEFAVECALRELVEAGLETEHDVDLVERFLLAEILQDLQEAKARGVPKSNQAKKGDPDYGVKAYGKPGAKDEDFEKKHPRGGKGSPQGGKFVKKGAGSSEQVEAVQRGLGMQAPTGTYDPGTAASVIAFQKKHGLQADGIVGHQTALALAGNFDGARRATPGPMDRQDRELLLQRHQPKGGARRSRGRAKRTRKQSKGERIGGGRLIEEDHGAGLAEAKIDKLGNWHDLLGKFTVKGAKGGPKAGAPAGVIPEYDPGDLTFGKSAGGSNGARWARHRDGSRWLVKTYRGDEDRIATELLSNAVYREMGARVPRAGRIRLHNGKQALAYPALEGKPRSRVFQGKRAEAPSVDVGAHFMTDALLANWDVAGLEDDNILWDPAGNPFRVDQGGTLEFRAMGGRKDFGPVPVEVTSMLAPGGQSRRSAAVTWDGMRAQAAQIARVLTPEKLDALVAGAQFKDAAMRKRVRENLGKRVAWMAGFAGGLYGAPEWEPPKKKHQVKPPPIWLAEAAIPHAWNEALHPRDEHGKFIKKIGGLPGGKAIQLDSKTTVKKDKDGTFRVVRSGQIIKGFQTPEDAARAALDRSAKSADPDSVGGEKAHKNYNDYLKSRGVSNVDAAAPGSVQFGGKSLSVEEAEKELSELRGRLYQAEHLGKADKYVARSVPTLKAREEELAKKVLTAGGNATVAPPQPDEPKAVPEIGQLPVGAKYRSGKDFPWMEIVGDTGEGLKIKKPDGEVVTMPKDVLKATPFEVEMPGGGVTSSEMKPGTPIASTAIMKSLPVGAQVEVVGGTVYEKKPGGLWQNLSMPHHKPVPSDNFDGGIVLGNIKLKSMAGAPGTSTPAPAKKVKPIKGMQAALPLGEGGIGPKLKDLDLEPGDVIQFKKGGWKYTVKSVAANGGMTVQGPNGKHKSWSGWSKPMQVQKADGSKLKLKDPDAAPAVPAASSSPPMSVQAIAAGMVPGKPGQKIGDLPDGAVIATPTGQIGVLKKSEPAYSGYVSAYDIKTGSKFEPNATAYPPTKFSDDPKLMAAAQAQLAEAQKGTKVTTAAAGGAPAAPAAQVGPPAAFQGVASWSAAKPLIAAAGQAKLTPDEKNAIQWYTGSGYSSINPQLRNSKKVGDPNVARKARAIDKALEKAPRVKEDVWIGRKTSNDEWKTQAKAGNIVQDNGFLSSSVNPGTWSGDITLNILVPAGSQALYVGGISSHPGEQEVILPRGSMFEVLKREEKGGYGTTLWVRML